MKREAARVESDMLTCRMIAFDLPHGKMLMCGRTLPALGSTVDGNVLCVMKVFGIVRLGGGRDSSGNELGSGY